MSYLKEQKKKKRRRKVAKKDGKVIRKIKMEFAMSNNKLAILSKYDRILRK